MKLKNLLLITGLIFIINGILGLFFSSIQLDIYDIEIGPGAMYMSQWEGLASIFMGLLGLLFRNVNDAISLKVISFAFIIYFLGGLTLSVMGTLDGRNNEIGWGVAAFCFIFMIGYIYFLFGKNIKSIK